MWTWGAFYLRIKLWQRVLTATGTPHASSQQQPLTIRGLNCLCLFNKLKFFVLVPRCGVCCATRSRQQSHCVSRPNFLFCKKRNNNSLAQSNRAISSGSPSTHLSPLLMQDHLDWSALQPQHAGQRRIICQLLYIHAFKMSGLGVRALSCLAS